MKEMSQFEAKLSIFEMCYRYFNQQTELNETIFANMSNVVMITTRNLSGIGR